MTIEQTRVVDFVAFDKAGDDAFLAISNHLVWDENEGEHLFLLQDKLNAYLEFIESGQLYVHYPHLKGKKIAIKLYNKYPLSELASVFFEKASAIIDKAGFSLRLGFPDLM